MSQQTDKLTPSAIEKMLESDAEKQSMIVQVFDVKPTKNGRMSCIISDGDFFTKALINDDTVLKQGQTQFAIICIEGHGVLKNNIGIQSFKLVTKYSQKLGNPLEWSTSKQNASELKSHKQFKFTKSAVKKEVKKEEPRTEAKPNHDKASSYELIDDLYIGLSRWTILCRITRKVLKQSPKKGTPILEIELVDKTKKRIIGTFFNQAATQFNDYLNQGRVYQISKGRLIEGDYNNSKNQKISPFTLIFDAKSQFNEVSDINIIAKTQDTAITLGQVFQRRIFNQQFDVVAYVKQVKQESTVQKDDKNFTVKQIVLIDPEAKITMNANLWRWKQPFQSDMAEKVLIFNRFILKQNTKGSIYLSSGMRSAVIINHEHPLKKYEGRKIDTSDFTIVTQARQRYEEDTSQMCFTTKELERKIGNMREGETIKSMMTLWINRFACLKKWNYEACPKCRKAAEKYSKCNNCNQAIEQTTLNFVMGTEVSDSYGSLWITMYDDLAKKIFYDMGNTAASQLQQLSKDELVQKLQKYQYQALKLKIITKKDDEGRIRHTVPKMYQLSEQREAKANLLKINELMATRN